MKDVGQMKRRKFIKLVAGTAALSGALGHRIAVSAEMPKLEEGDAMATTLGYKHAVADVDKAAFSKYKDGQTCANCSLYQGAADAPWAGCAIFAGKAVNADGWCNAYVAKPAS